MADIVDSSEEYFLSVFQDSLQWSSRNSLTQWFDSAVERSIREKWYAPYVAMTLHDTREKLLTFEDGSACAFEHELFRLPRDVLKRNLGVDRVHPPVTCPNRNKKCCGHPELNWLLWCALRWVILTGEETRILHYLSPLYALMHQDGVFAFMVAMGDQVHRMDEGWVAQQTQSTNAVSQRIWELVGKLDARKAA